MIAGVQQFTLPLFHSVCMEPIILNILLGQMVVLDFDVTNVGGYCPWPLSTLYQCPSPDITGGGANTPNWSFFFGPYEDIWGSYNGNREQEYETVVGNFPCRQFVVTWDNCADFSCTTQYTTSEIVMYETTNVIDVYIQSKPICSRVE